MGATMSYSYSTQNGYSQSTSGSMSSPMVAAISSMSPLYPFYNEDGSYANVDGYNPLALYDKDLGEINRVINQTINMNPYLQVDFGLGIYAKPTLGVNLTDQREYNYWSALYNPQGMAITVLVNNITQETLLSLGQTSWVGTIHSMKSTISA